MNYWFNGFTATSYVFPYPYSSVPSPTTSYAET